MGIGDKMISLKKIHADQLLKVALVLSLLRVDPSNYLEYGWESQLAALHDGDGWQLELRAATPFTDITHYSNRKAVIPLIEDLVRFNHNSNDVTAYLLNSVHSNNTSPSGQNFTGSAAASASETPATSNATVGQRPSGEESQPAASVELDELFLNTAPFSDSASIFDENLANLTDFGETIAQVYPYLGLPAKDELLLDSLMPPEPPTIDELALIGAASNYGMPESPSVDDLVEWEDFYSNRTIVKSEPKEEPESPASDTLEAADAIVETDTEDSESSSSVVLTPEVGNHKEPSRISRAIPTQKICYSPKFINKSHFCPQFLMKCETEENYSATAENVSFALLFFTLISTAITLCVCMGQTPTA